MLGNFVLEDNTDLVKISKGPQIGTFLNRPLLFWHSMLATVSGLFLLFSQDDKFVAHLPWLAVQCFEFILFLEEGNTLQSCQMVNGLPFIQNLSCHLITVGLIHTFIHWQRSLRHTGLVTE